MSRFKRESLVTIILMNVPSKIIFLMLSSFLLLGVGCDFKNSNVTLKSGPLVRPPSAAEVNAMAKPSPSKNPTAATSTTADETVDPSTPEMVKAAIKDARFKQVIVSFEKTNAADCMKHKTQMQYAKGVFNIFMTCVSKLDFTAADIALVRKNLTVYRFNISGKYSDSKKTYSFDTSTKPALAVKLLIPAAVWQDLDMKAVLPDASATASPLPSASPSDSADDAGDGQVGSDNS